MLGCAARVWWEKGCWGTQGHAWHCIAAHRGTWRDHWHLLQRQPWGLDLHSQNGRAGPALHRAPNHFSPCFIQLLVAPAT